jgi:thiamine biosynthesis lipoprotein
MDGIERIIQKLLSRLRMVSLEKVLSLLVRWLKKGKWLLLLLVCLLILQLFRSRPRVVTLQGYAMDKPYSIQYEGKWANNYQPAIDSLLADLAQAVALDDEDSVVKKFNQQGCEAFPLENPFLYPLLEKSKEVYNRTKGVFDPTIAPLVDLWKKQLAVHEEPSEYEIDALLEYVSLDYVVVNKNRIKRLKEGVKIDVGGLVYGYAVDTVAGFLKYQGVKDLLVKIGDEAIAYGKQAKNKDWQVSETFTVKQDTIAPITITINLGNKAISVARKNGYWMESSDQTSLLIDPQTGYPPQNTLLAVIVLAQDCISADAYTTAIMTKDLTFAQELLKENKDIEAFLIYQDHADPIEFYTSDGLVMDKSEDGQAISLSLRR